MLIASSYGILYVIPRRRTKLRIVEVIQANNTSAVC